MPGETWSIRRLLAWIDGYLAQRGIEHPRRSAEWLIGEVCGLSRMQIYLDIDRPLEADELARLREMVVRRGRGEPLQYITGNTSFRSIEVLCEPGVLIPRPETEMLVEYALEALRARHTGDSEGEEPDDEGNEPQVNVLEIGTGTGCIALSIASEMPEARVLATDVSATALKLAARNRAALGLEKRVGFVQCSLADGVKDRFMGTFELLISNPPYIPTAVMAELPSEVVDHEPALALDGGADGLDVFRRLVELAPRALAPSGVFAVELFEGHLDQAADLVRGAQGWESVEVKQDLAGRPRVLLAVRSD